MMKILNKECPLIRIAVCKDLLFLLNRLSFRKLSWLKIQKGRMWESDPSKYSDEKYDPLVLLLRFHSSNERSLPVTLGLEGLKG